MACTGELPPNTRSGQSFVHDPKVAGESEVKAQIKLRFVTAAGQPVVVVRCFQLTQRKASLAFRALDNVLQTVNRATGAREALSYRCADLDRAVPVLMGVPAAVLDSVVFVHQEDSNWPLADAQAVKRRFDDIFAATKYTRALEALRKLKTDKAAEARELKLKLDTLRVQREAARVRALAGRGCGCGCDGERRVHGWAGGSEKSLAGGGEGPFGAEARSLPIDLPATNLGLTSPCRDCGRRWGRGRRRRPRTTRA